MTDQEDIYDIIAQESLQDTVSVEVEDSPENLWLSGCPHVNFRGKYSAILYINIRFFHIISPEIRSLVSHIIDYVSYCCCQRSYIPRYVDDLTGKVYYEIPIYWNRSFFRFMDYLWTIQKLLNSVFKQVVCTNIDSGNFINFVSFGWSNALYEGPIVRINEEYFGHLNPPSSILSDQAEQWFQVIAPERRDDIQLELAKFYYFRLEIKR